jgi:SAM-dependent methyltransferase
MSKPMMDRPWNHNIHYHKLVLRSLPTCRHRALDVGCGQGQLARELAQHCEEVIAIDVDHETIARARTAAARLSVRATFIEGDVMTHPFSDSSFDFITAVATLHHLEIRPALTRFRNLLRPAGVLAIVGLFRGEPVRDWALGAVAFPVSWGFRCFRGFADVGAPVQDPRETLREIRSVCQTLLPGAVLRRHLLFRYSLIWRKPGG